MQHHIPLFPSPPGVPSHPLPGRRRLHSIALSTLLSVSLATVASIAATAQTPAQKSSKKTSKVAAVRQTGKAKTTSAPVVSRSKTVGPFGTIKDLEKFLADLRESDKEKQEARERKNGKAAKIGEEGEENEQAGEFLEGYLQQLKMRARPDGTIDPEDYQRAIDHMKKMPVAAIAGGASKTTINGANGITTLSVTPPLSPGPIAVTAQAWEFIGPRRMGTPYQTYYGPPGSFTSGRVNGVAFDPSRAGVAYLTGAQGGVWKTIDNGKNWTPLGDNWDSLYASAVAVDKNGVVYVGLGDFDGLNGATGRGIMKSTDGGLTFNLIGNAQLRLQGISAIAIDPENPQLIVVSTGRGAAAGSLWRTTNGGTTWQKVGPVDSDWSAVSIGEKNPLTGVRFYYASVIGRGAYFSTNQGLNWQFLNAPLAFNLPGGAVFPNGIRVAASPNNWQDMYIIDASTNSQDGRVFKGHFNPNLPGPNQFEWTDITANFPATAGGFNNFSQAYYDLFIAPVKGFDGRGNAFDMVYGAGISVGATYSSPVDWSDISFTLSPSAKTHNDQHALAGSVFNQNFSLLGNDGGIYGVFYNPSLQDWQIDATLSATLGITQFYHADWSAKDPNIMIGGAQDNATPQSSGTLSQWNVVGGGDGGGCSINPSNNNIQYASSQGGRIYATTNLWQSTNDISPNYKDAAPFVNVMTVDPGAPNYLFVGTSSLYRYNQATSSWLVAAGWKPGDAIKQMGDFAFDSTVTAVAASATPLYDLGGNKLANAGQVVYVGTANGSIYVTNNALANDDTTSKINWAKVGINANVPAGAVTAININPSNPNDILMTKGGANGVGHVYRCQNVLFSAPTIFTNQSGFGTQSLPDITVNDITRDALDPANTFYVATDIGVFTTRDSGSTWQDMTRPLGLPIVQTTAIKASAPIPQGTGYLNVATFGRGMWRYKLPSVVQPNLAIKQTLQRVGSTVQVTVTMTNTQGVATNVFMNSASIMLDNGTTVPISSTSLGNLPVGFANLNTGVSRVITLYFPAAQLPRGAAATVKFNLTYSGLTLDSALRTRLP